MGGGSAGVVPFHTVSPLEGLTDALGKTANVFYDRGLPKISELAHDTEFTTEANGGKPGLTFESYGNADLSGQPEKTAVVPHINVTGLGWDSLGDSDAMDAIMAAPNVHVVAPLHRLLQRAGSG